MIAKFSFSVVRPVVEVRTVLTIGTFAGIPVYVAGMERNDTTENPSLASTEVDRLRRFWPTARTVEVKITTGCSKLRLAAAELTDAELSSAIKDMESRQCYQAFATFPFDSSPCDYIDSRAVCLISEAKKRGLYVPDYAS